MATAHNLGFPRIGARRELKQAVEAYWRGELDEAGLAQTGRELRLRHWRLQAAAGLTQLPVGDFSWYDQVLDTSALLGAVPARFRWSGATVDLDTAFRMARGRAPRGADAPACEMTKWFDTNYHYLVPELHRDQRLRLASEALFEQVAECQAAGFSPRPVLVGPLTWLWLGKVKGEPFERLTLLDEVLAVYREVLARLRAQGVSWVQIDEPILALDLPPAWQAAFAATYDALQGGPKILLTTYFGGLGENLALALDLPVQALHLDAMRDPAQVAPAVARLPADKILSLGVVDGRNIWRSDLAATLDGLEPIHARLGERLWLAPSCSLLHVPVDLAQETALDPELASWFAFATQKLNEVATLARALREGRAAVAATLAANTAALASRRASARIHNAAVQRRLAALTPAQGDRLHPYPVRAQAQRACFDLPLFPTTTIGSFPQTAEIRKARQEHRQGRLDEAAYQRVMQAQIALAVERQEAVGLDVLVHGEAERNDMVEYFGEQLAGFAFTAQGWVQSYGSRCVKPPIIYGDVARPAPMTVTWSRYAQSLTAKLMKGMLTGPVTILQWSFVRDDQPRRDTALQIALALRDEVLDLEAAGIGAIQVDEPALREGLPLRRPEWASYLDWTSLAFRVAVGAVQDATQIHTHMCYAEFNDIIQTIAAMDADVITIETSRSDMELLDAFERFRYPNEIGPGVYDVHTPSVPTVEEMVTLMRKAAALIPPERLWVNPDCGLKTRGWAEVEPALANLVEAARRLRAEHAPG